MVRILILLIALPFLPAGCEKKADETAVKPPDIPKGRGAGEGVPPKSGKK